MNDKPKSNVNIGNCKPASSDELKKSYEAYVAKHQKQERKKRAKQPGR